MFHCAIGVSVLCKKLFIRRTDEWLLSRRTLVFLKVVACDRYLQSVSFEKLERTLN